MNLFWVSCIICMHYIKFCSINGLICGGGGCSLICRICISLLLGLLLHPFLLSFDFYTRVHDPLVLQHKANTHNYIMHMCSELDFTHRTSHTMKIQRKSKYAFHMFYIIS